MFKKIYLRIFLYTVAIGIFFALGYLKVVPGGVIGYSTDFGKKNYFIGQLTPKDRLGDDPAENVIIGGPVYFNLKSPRNFEEVSVEMEYENDTDYPVIELGLLADKTVWRYELKPIENRIIDRLSLVWDQRTEDGVTMLSRPQTDTGSSYSSLRDFLLDPPDRREIALYHYEPEIEYLIDDYSASGEGIKPPFTLRGNFKIYVYIKNETLSFQFKFKDINRNRDADPADILLFADDQLIDSRRLEDDGIETDSGETSQSRELTFTVPGLPEGAYLLELKANGDLITELQSGQDHLSFTGDFWIYESVRKPYSLISDATVIYAKTTNPGKLQTLKTDSEYLDINETYKQFEMKLKSATSVISFEQDDLMVSSDGTMSLVGQGMVNPRFYAVSPNLDINGRNINYVLTTYTPDGNLNKSRSKTVTFNLANAYRDDGNYGFLVSIPGLRAEDGEGSGLRIGKISVRYKGKTLLEKLREKFR